MIMEINGQQWEILKVEAHHPGLFVDGTARAGTTWPMTLKMYLSDELKGDAIARVIAHELSHMYLHSTQISQQETWSEEELCEFMGIYGWNIAALTQGIHKELYPSDILRSWDTVLREARVG